MFEYILAGFTGSFFSYFCVWFLGAETHAFAAGTSSDRVLSVMDINNDKIERKLELLLRKINEKL